MHMHREYQLSFTDAAGVLVNAELRFRWYMLCLRSKCRQVVPGVVAMLQ